MNVTEAYHKICLADRDLKLFFETFDIKEYDKSVGKEVFKNFESYSELLNIVKSSKTYANNNKYKKVVSQFEEKLEKYITEYKL